jgi:hypothetical protein
VTVTAPLDTPLMYVLRNDFIRAIDGLIELKSIIKI